MDIQFQLVSGLNLIEHLKYYILQQIRVIIVITKNVLKQMNVVNKI